MAGLNKSMASFLLSEKSKSSLNEVAESVSKPAAEQKAGLSTLPIEKLKRGQYQPRQYMDDDALQELAESIKAQGIIQPIVVRKLLVGDQYEIIAGERRWRAAGRAGLDRVPVVIKEISDEVAMAMALIENIQREDLNVVEEAVALNRLIQEFGLTQQEAADKVGKSRVTVTNLLRILNLNMDVRLLLEQGKIELGHAKVLLALDGDRQSQIARIVSLKGLSVRETEQLVKQQLQGKKAVKSAPMDPNIKHLQTDLSEKLGAKVTLQHGHNGKGKLVIHYASLDELDGILSHIK